MNEELKNEFIESLHAPGIDRNEYYSRFLKLAHDHSFINECLEMIKEKKCHREARSRVAFLLYLSENATRAINLWDDDIKEGNAGWWQQARYAEALATTGQINKAIAEAERIYAEFPEAMNLRSCIALQWTEDMDIEEACAFAHKDDSEGKMTAGGRLNYARILAKAGHLELAEKQVKKAYVADKSLKDGMFILAESAFRNGDNIHAIQLLLEDVENGRLSEINAGKAAEYYYFAGDEKGAFKLIKRLYNKHPEARDAYARIGWAMYVVRAPHPERAWNLLQTDYKLNRLSEEGLLRRAIMSHSVMGLDHAISLCAEQYKTNEELKDLYSELAWQLLHDGRISDALNTFVLDYKAGTMSEKWEKRYMEVMELFHPCDCDKEIN